MCRRVCGLLLMHAPEVTTPASEHTQGLSVDLDKHDRVAPA